MIQYDPTYKIVMNGTTNPEDAYWFYWKGSDPFEDDTIETSLVEMILDHILQMNDTNTSVE